MRNKIERMKSAIDNKRGMTLTELLVAMTLLVVVSLCFLPLFQTYYGNISTVGDVTKSTYESEGLIEKLIGMASNHIDVGSYQVTTANIPLSMTVDTYSLSTESYGLSDIAGKTVNSVPEQIEYGFNTFISNSVTQKMVCYPRHIADDFLEKDITLYASGFEFSSRYDQWEFYVTSSTGQLTKIEQGSNDGTYYKLAVSSEDTRYATLTLKGDNGVICFENSPLIIRYKGYNPSTATTRVETDFAIEIDAPTVIMVGEKAQDGNYYYYVTSGETNEDGNLDIVRKKMDSKDLQGGNASVKLSSAMNDVEWVPEGEGDNGVGGKNEYGYYVMCGDEGQIRRFWRNGIGNYYWGGDYTKEYDTVNGVVQGNTPTYGQGVNTTYSYQKDPESGNGIPLNNNNSPYNVVHHDRYNSVPGVAGKLFTQTAFSVNALLNKTFNVYTTGNTLYLAYNSYKKDADEDAAVEDTYLTNRVSFKAQTGVFSSTTYYWPDVFYGPTTLKNWDTTYYDTKLTESIFTVGSALKARSTAGMEDSIKNMGVTLTSVDCIKMSSPNGSEKYPNNTYTLYCGYIPGVMDIWVGNNSPENEVGNRNITTFSRWRATLGIGFTDGSKSYFRYLGSVFKTQRSNYGIDLIGSSANYKNAPNSYYKITGVCAASNYAGMTNTLTEAANAHANSGDKYRNHDTGGSPGDERDQDNCVFDPPLNMGYGQGELQNGQNETVVSFSYLSDPYAFADVPIQDNYYDLSPTRDFYDGVLEWTFDDSLTIMDMDSIEYEAYDSATQTFNTNNISLAVGYVVAGLVWEAQNTKVITIPTVMNNGIVFLRAGGVDNEENASGYLLDNESNIFHQFYYTDVYNVNRNIEGINGEGTAVKNTMMLCCSANYWRDAYHPMFYSMYGTQYDPDDGRDKYSYIMSHILQDKRLTSTAWGYTWQFAPEAMWGASDGTLMSWYLDVDAKSITGNLADVKQWYKTGPKTVCAEFQSYQNLEYANEHEELYDETSFVHRHKEEIGWKTGSFNLPLDWEDMGYNSDVDGNLSGTDTDKNGSDSSPRTKVTGDVCSWGNPYMLSLNGKTPTLSDDSYCYTDNSYWDKCSCQLEDQFPGTIISAEKNGSNGSTKGLGMMSPLKSVEDVCYANDTWVVCGVQGLDNPFKKTYTAGSLAGKTIYYCQQGAITTTNPTSDTGSWICVRTWYDQSNGADSGPCEGNCSYTWHVVRVSTTTNANIMQVTYANGMWYAVGYIDSNKNGIQDDGEHAVVYYAKDPSKACGGTENGNWDGGWKLAKCKDQAITDNYTKCWINNEGQYDCMDIYGVNAVASRND